ncbi:alpha/beta hydrolase [Corynebacterium renale]|uniref:S-formylglutathione hydrolase FrmB n=1 Tax=Corynebacterium renale TaxID=1724 RepID=A0A2A9DLX7_9CORY|nr:alpha/beta hydrolase family protein [Corynebacterium renale]PFG27371.1 S-formylglutathione hydrolase FrmB [Corynebacterium renale]SQI23542.1 trehalose corynomycolyl transferase A [Corynebacterium renale]
MKLTRRFGASIAALGLATTLAAAPFATAAEKTAADVAGDAPVGTVAPLSFTPMSVTDQEPQEWLSKVDGKFLKSYQVHSPSMNKDIPVAVIPAHDKDGNPVSGAPTVYLLNGAGGAEQDNDWIVLAKTVDFYKDKSVNVVIPMQGAFTYYTDWVDETLDTPYLKGPQKWETFLTKELPGPIEQELNANNKRAVVGFSMSATSALLLPQHNQGFYDAAASFSGCAATSSFLPYEYLRLTVSRGGAQPEQMWGPRGGTYNVYNDALVNAEKLRGTELYISTATGLASETDMAGYMRDKGVSNEKASASATTLIVEGGVIEGAMNACTHDLKAKLDRAGIPANYELRNTGTHSWPGWRSDLETSWNTTLAPALGLEPAK